MKNLLLCLTILLAGLLASNNAFAQKGYPDEKENTKEEKAKEKEKEREEREAEDFESRLPDDSILIAENFLDSIPEKYTKERKLQVIEKFMADAGYRCDMFQNGGTTVLMTLKKDVTKSLSFYDRKVQILFVFFVEDEKNRIGVRTYSIEKVDSKGRSWQILTRKSKPKILNYDADIRKHLKKRFRK